MYYRGKSISSIICLFGTVFIDFCKNIVFFVRNERVHWNNIIDIFYHVDLRRKNVIFQSYIDKLMPIVLNSMRSKSSWCSCCHGFDVLLCWSLLFSLLSVQLYREEYRYILWSIQITLCLRTNLMWVADDSLLYFSPNQGLRHFCDS